LPLAQTIFTLFFAIFWGAIANVHARFKPFGFLGSGNNDGKRIVLSLVLLNVLPIIYFVAVFFMLGLSTWRIQGWSWAAALKTFLSVLAAFGIFGFYRLEIAVIEKWPHAFYGELELCKRRQEHPTDYDERLALRNLASGLAYILIALGAPLAVAMGRLW
jgi:hypothetical protein